MRSSREVSMDMQKIHTRDNLADMMMKSVNHFVRVVKEIIVRMQKIHTKGNLADNMMKPINTYMFAWRKNLTIAYQKRKQHNTRQKDDFKWEILKLVKSYFWL